MTTTSATVPVVVELSGGLNDGAADYALTRVNAVLHQSALPVVGADVDLRRLSGPADARVRADAVVRVDEMPVRAHGEGRNARAAVEELETALRRRLEGLADHGGPGRHRAGAVRPPTIADIRRQTLVPLHVCSVDEALTVLRAEGRQFRLFTEEATGQDAVIWWSGTGYALQRTDPDVGRVPAPPRPVELVTARPPRLTVPDAVALLGAQEASFLFFVPDHVRAGWVVHRAAGGGLAVLAPLR